MGRQSCYPPRPSDCTAVQSVVRASATGEFARRLGRELACAYGGARRADQVAEAARQAVPHQHVERLTKPGDIAQPALDVLDREHRGMLVQQEAEQRPLGEVRDRCDARSLHEHVFAYLP